LAVVLLVVTVVLTWFALLRRRFDPIALVLGGLTWPALVGLVLAGVAPGGAYLTTLPTLAGGVAATVSVLTGRPMVRALVDALAAAVAVVVLAPTVSLFFPALGLSSAAVPAVFATVAVLVALPVLDLLLPAVEEPARRFRAALP